MLLGRYLRIPPSEIIFAYGTHGKPRVAAPQTTLAFNMAHSGELAAYAFAFGCEVGIDVEQPRRMTDEEDIVRRFFSPEEVRDWLAVHQAVRNITFFRGWTRKEAFIKAVGQGLSFPLHGFRVSLGETARLLEIAGDPAAASHWTLTALTPGEGYLGALAAPKPDCRVRVYTRLTAAEAVAIAEHSTEFPPLA
jgi:4'-phosphopantetheinyl transferase